MKTLVVFPAAESRASIAPSAASDWTVLDSCVSAFSLSVPPLPQPASEQADPDDRG